MKAVKKILVTIFTFFDKNTGTYMKMIKFIIQDEHGDMQKRNQFNLANFTGKKNTFMPHSLLLVLEHLNSEILLSQRWLHFEI